MDPQILSIILNIVIGVISSLIAYLITKRLDKKQNIDVSEYKSFPFILSTISVICCIIAVFGIVTSIISLWINGRKLLIAKTKAYRIGFFLSTLSLLLSGVNAGTGGIWGWYSFSQDYTSFFNTGPNYRPLILVNNASTTSKDLAPSSPNYWTPSISAKLSDTVSFLIQYHNTSDRNTKDIHLHFHYYQANNVLMCGAALNEKFSNNIVLGFANIDVFSFPTVLYRLDFLQAFWYPDEKAVPIPLPFQQSGFEIMTLGGLNIGDIEKGEEHQGVFVFRVVIHRTQ